MSSASVSAHTWSALVAVAPLVASLIVLLITTSMATGTHETILPMIFSEDTEDFQGSLTEFGLPYADNALYAAFLLSFIVAVVEQVTGFRLRLHSPSLKTSFLVSLIPFGLAALIVLVFSSGNFSLGDRLTMWLMFGMLLIPYLTGILGLKVISFFENAIVKKILEPDSAEGQSEEAR